MVKLYFELYNEHRAKLLYELLVRLLRGERIKAREVYSKYAVDRKWVYRKLGPYLEGLGVIKRVYERY